MHFNMVFNRVFREIFRSDGYMVTNKSHFVPYSGIISKVYAHFRSVPLQVRFICLKKMGLNIIVVIAILSTKMECRFE